jgi:Holliday junction resolvase RusA-like endonuclease
MSRVFWSHAKRQVTEKKRRLKVSRTEPWVRTILGQPFSKANSRQLVTVKGRTRFIKSNEALSYLRTFAMQCPTLDPMFEGEVHVEIDIFYTSRKPDLDESLILDALQGRVYRNDRQVRSKTVNGWIDSGNPRTVIRVSPLAERAWPDHQGRMRQ